MKHYFEILVFLIPIVFAQYCGYNSDVKIYRKIGQPYYPYYEITGRGEIYSSYQQIEVTLQAKQPLSSCLPKTTMSRIFNLTFYAQTQYSVYLQCQTPQIIYTPRTKVYNAIGSIFMGKSGNLTLKDSCTSSVKVIWQQQPSNLTWAYIFVPISAFILAQIILLTIYRCCFNKKRKMDSLIQS